MRTLTTRMDHLKIEILVVPAGVGHDQMALGNLYADVQNPVVRFDHRVDRVINQTLLRAQRYLFWHDPNVEEE